MERVILKALEKRRINRYPDVLTFMRELQALLVTQTHISIRRQANTLTRADKTKEQYLNEGIQLYRLGWYEEALATFEQALRLDPHFADALFGKGNALYFLKRYAHELRNEIDFDQALDFWNQNGKIECLLLCKYSRLKDESSRKERNQMWPRFATSSSLCCSFCHKPKDQVEHLLAGPRGVSMCNTGVDCCQQVMQKEREQQPVPPRS